MSLDVHQAPTLHYSVTLRTNVNVINSLHGKPYLILIWWLWWHINSKSFKWSDDFIFSWHGVMHQTCLVQWTWNILLIRDYPGTSDECNPCSSHPSYKNPPRQRRISKEMTILERVMTAWHLEDITPPRTSQEAEETKEKRKRKAQITFLAPSVKFRRPMPAFRFFEYLIRFWSY